MRYRGFEGVVEYDDDARIFHGEVINVNGIVTFQGRTVDELERAFRDSVEDYVEFCRQRGVDPGKPYTGEFIVRADADLHKRVATAARRAKKSLNAWVVEALDEAAAKLEPPAKPRRRPPRGREKA